MRNPPARVDANQPEIVAALRAAGCTVQHLHMVGQGCPDLLICYEDLNVLLEVKMPGEGLTPVEQRWHDHWTGMLYVVHSAEEALNVMGLL